MPNIGQLYDMTTEDPRFTVLLEGGYFLGRRPNYDVGPDGRFLMIKNEEPEVGQINVVLNWFEELKRLVPTP